METLVRLDAQHATSDGAMTRFFDRHDEATKFARVLTVWGWHCDVYPQLVQQALSIPQRDKLLALPWPVVPTAELVRMATLTTPTFVLADPNLTFHTTEDAHA